MAAGLALVVVTVTSTGAGSGTATFRGFGGGSPRLAQDHYMGRRIRNPQAAEVIDQHLRHALDTVRQRGENHGSTMAF